MRYVLFLLCTSLAAQQPVVEIRKAEPVEQGAAAAAEEVETADYVRFLNEAKHPQRLQTAIVRYERADGASVDLISAVHLGDPSYYDALNLAFKDYEAVLYEMVGGPVPPKDQMAKRDRGNLAWLGTLHSTLQKSLGLEGQLEGVDYAVQNMVHADVSMAEFESLREQKNESFLALMLRAYQAQQELASTGQATGGMSLPQLMTLLSGDGSQNELKATLAGQFHEVERLMAGIEGPHGSVIIGSRNDKALKVLEAELKKGKRKLAVFYGGAHLPDMETKLIRQGWKRSAAEQLWLDAWTIRR
jgi:hypothetical protein